MAYSSTMMVHGTDHTTNFATEPAAHGLQGKDCVLQELSVNGTMVTGVDLAVLSKAMESNTSRRLLNVLFYSDENETHDEDVTWYAYDDGLCPLAEALTVNKTLETLYIDLERGGWMLDNVFPANETLLAVSRKDELYFRAECRRNRVLHVVRAFTVDTSK